MIERDDVVFLSKEEFDEVVEIECQKRLGMSTSDFIGGRRNGESSDSTAIHDIETLLHGAKKQRTNI